MFCLFWNLLMLVMFICAVMMFIKYPGPWVALSGLFCLCMMGGPED